MSNISCKQLLTTPSLTGMQKMSCVRILRSIQVPHLFFHTIGEKINAYLKEKNQCYRPKVDNFLITETCFRHKKLNHSMSLL